MRKTKRNCKTRKGGGKVKAENEENCLRKAKMRKEAEVKGMDDEQIGGGRR